MDLRAVIDLETTGLKPGFILEIACIVIDDNYEEHGRFHSIIRPAGWGDSWILEKFEEAALRLHENNGLIQDVYEGVYEYEAEKDFCSFLQKFEGNTVYMMGNSIASLDIPFLKARMPNVFKYLHYRSIDVSGVRVYLKQLFGKDYHSEKGGKHRAMDDVLDCIKEAKYLDSIIKYPRDLLDDALNTLAKYEGENGENYYRIVNEYRNLLK